MVGLQCASTGAGAPPGRGLEKFARSAMLRRRTNLGTVVSKKLPTYTVDTKWFLHLLEDKGFTQRSFGPVVGINRSSLNRLLNGRRGLQVDEASLMARALGVPLEMMLAKFGIAPDKAQRGSVAIIGTVSPRSGRIASKLATGAPRKADRPLDATDSTLAVFLAAENSPFHGWTFYAAKLQALEPTAIGRLSIVENDEGELFLCIPQPSTERGKWVLGRWDGTPDNSQADPVVLAKASPVTWIRT